MKKKILILMLLIFAGTFISKIEITKENPAPIHVIEPCHKVTTQESNIKEFHVIKRIDMKQFLGQFKLTAYCSCAQCCGQWAANRANGVVGANGEVLTTGNSIAVDPKIIPLGSKVEINGKVYIAQDTGGAIKGNRIDVYYSSHQSALNFGTQNADVYLLP